MLADNTATTKVYEKTNLKFCELKCTDARNFGTKQMPNFDT